MTPRTAYPEVTRMRMRADRGSVQRAKADEVIAKLRAMWLAKLADWIAETVEETLAYYAFPNEHWRRIRTNNPLERIMREIRRPDA